MQDPKDKDTEDWVGGASALKNEKGELQLPMAPKNLLKSVALHAIVKDRDPVDLIEDIHDAVCFWLQDHHRRKNSNNVGHYSRRLDS